MKLVVIKDIDSLTINGKSVHLPIGFSQNMADLLTSYGAWQEGNATVYSGTVGAIMLAEILSAITKFHNLFDCRLNDQRKVPLGH